MNSFLLGSIGSSGRAGNELLDYILATAGWLLLWIAPIAGLILLTFFLFSLPLKRKEQASLLIDLVEKGLEQGQNPETTLVAVSNTGDRILGRQFARLAAMLQTGMRLSAALEKLPRFLPPQMTAMLKAGEKTGDIAKVLPACRQMLKDSLSQITKAHNYLVMLFFVITPINIVVVPMLAVYVVPKYDEIFRDMGVTPNLMNMVAHNLFWVVFAQVLILLAVYLGAAFYIGGPGLIAWFRRICPALTDWIVFRIPWRRKRMERDFSAMLALLLDADAPETEAVQIAAQCAANQLFQERAELAVADLRSGIKLSDALRRLADVGQLHWRLENASHSQHGFWSALKGWTEALDAKAFQQEQAFAHVFTTALVLFNGLVVGLAMAAFFQPITALIMEGALW